MYLPLEGGGLEGFERLLWVVLSIYHYIYCYFILVPKESNAKKRHPVNPPFGCVRSFGKFRPRPTRSAQTWAAFSLNFPSLAHRVQRGKTTCGSAAAVSRPLDLLVMRQCALQAGPFGHLASASERNPSRRAVFNVSVRS
jgi:hypothetical protein